MFINTACYIVWIIYYYCFELQFYFWWEIAVVVLNFSCVILHNRHLGLESDSICWCSGNILAYVAFKECPKRFSCRYHHSYQSTAFWDIILWESIDSKAAAIYFGHTPFCCMAPHRSIKGVSKRDNSLGCFFVCLFFRKPYLNISNCKIHTS